MTKLNAQKSKNFLKVLVVFVFVFTILFSTIPVLASEKIDSFESSISIFKDSVGINEEIIYNFGTESKHGIFRNIPLTSKDGPNIKINVLSVTDVEGKPYQYDASVSGNILNIKIGDPNTTVTGTKTYVISYYILNSLRSFTDHDEFYWNVTGNDWQIPIEKSSASVWFQPFPKDDKTLASSFKTACFTGVQGSKSTDCTSSIRSDRKDISDFSSTKVLNPKEGLTIALSFPKGLVNIINSTGDFSGQTEGPTNAFMAIFPVLITLFVVFIIYFGLRKARLSGRLNTDSRVSAPKIPKELKGVSIIAEYTPPENISPIDMGTLFDRSVDMRDVSSVILHLAIRGYLKINYFEKKYKFLFTEKDFELIKLKQGSDLTHPADKIIFDMLFFSRDSVKLSYLKKEESTAVQGDIAKIKIEVKDRLTKENYFNETSQKRATKFGKYAKISFSIILLCVFFGQIFSDVLSLSFIGPLLAGVGFVAVVVSLILSSKSQKLGDKLTQKGIDALRRILGFNLFLSVTEKDRMDFHNAPEKKPEQFTEYLPYAMALGIEKKWAKKFEGMNIPQPDWYQSNAIGTFIALDFASHMIMFSSNLSAISMPSGDASGFGGGGGSGGGGGGGDGGSW
ncbi:MAG: DUF2207 domain-containing protein [Candidatus Paceibacterota bacterium]|jgi:uncharacterized membrane protein